jgi:hypothetical protein
MVDDYVAWEIICGMTMLHGRLFVERMIIMAGYGSE